jgi:DNA-binding transcriptional LysR family regulator
MLLSPQDVVYFQTIAQTKNLRAAAEQLHVTQPALSHSLKRLESAYGGALFERTSKGLKVTRRGTQLLEESKVALRAWMNLGEPSNQVSAPPQLRIGMHPSVATYFASGFLAQAHRGFPTLGLDLVHGLSRDLTRLVIEGELEAAITMNPVRSPGLVIRELLTDTVTLVGTRNAIQASKHIIYDPALAQSQWLLKAFEKRNLKFETQTHSGSLEAIRAMAEASLGLAILPLRVGALAKTKLHVVVEEGPSFRDRLCFVCRPFFARSEFGRAMIEAAKTAADSSN